MKSKTAYYGVFTAFSIIVSYLEYLFAFDIGIPGVKLGLANVVVLAALYLFKPASALALSIFRILAAGFMFGNLFGVLYSLSGALLSFFVMWAAKKSRLFGIAGISVCGGVSHNIGQLLLAAVIMENIRIVYYLPVLLAAGTITGLLIGVTAGEVVKRLPVSRMK